MWFYRTPNWGMSNKKLWNSYKFHNLKKKKKWSSFFWAEHWTFAVFLKSASTRLIRAPKTNFNALVRWFCSKIACSALKMNFTSFFIKSKKSHG